MISSSANPLVRHARRLRKAETRSREGAVLVEGSRAVSVALRAGARIRIVFHTSGADGELLIDATRAAAGVHSVTPAVMAHLSGTVSPPDALAVVDLSETPEDEAVYDGATVLALVRDPATAGAIVASTVATGGRSAVFCSGSVDPFSPKTIRAAQGAHFHLAVVRAATASRVAARIRSAGTRLICLDSAGPAPWEADLRDPFALIVGDSGPGAMPEDVAALADGRVAVPAGAVAPPLAVRTAIVLYEGARQRWQSR